MRYLYTALCALLCCLAATALRAQSDTTWVQGHQVRLTYYNDYDTVVAFPNNATESYRKIYMIFTLGKYQCPGYNPSNPGETSQGHTGWCGDWDYTVQTLLLPIRGADSGKTFELGRLITPYANTNAPRTPWTWKQRYVYDVTDLYPILKDSAKMRIHYSGYSGGFTADIRFAFVHGLPEREVTGVTPLWHGDFAYGHGATPINRALDTITVPVPANTQASVAHLIVTGHGGDDNNCAEFCPNTYTLKHNGAQLAQQRFFKNDCGGNDLYPQSGTWIYGRANWCPGAQVADFAHPLPPGGVVPTTLSLSFPAYTSATTQGGNPASYTLGGYVVHYGGGFSALINAELEDVIAPTNHERHFRANPIALAPVIKVHNRGASPITSLKIGYGLAGQAHLAYDWAGTLAPYASAVITLPPMAELRLAAGSYGFVANIKKVNGVVDEDTTDNRMRTSFTAAPAWPNKIVMQLKGNDEYLEINHAICQTSWRIEDSVGTVLYNRDDCRINTLCKDTVMLTPGRAYRLVVADTTYYGFYDIAVATVVGEQDGTGLKGFSNGSGYIRAYKYGPGNVRIALPGASTGGYEGNFGSGFTQEFYVSEVTEILPALSAAPILTLYPNPAREVLHVEADNIGQNATLTMTDALGREVYTSILSGSATIRTAGFAPGLYDVVVRSAQGVARRGVVVGR